MAQIKGLEIHPVADGVEVWKLGTADISVERALQCELVSLDGPVEVDRGRPTRVGRRGLHELRVASLDLEGFDRIRGLVVSRSAVRLAQYLLHAARPTRGTVLATWLQGRPLNELSVAELGELLERAWLLGQDVQGTPLGRQLPNGGFALVPEHLSLPLERLTLDGQDWWLDRIRGHATCAAVVDRILTIGGHRVPQPLHLLQHGPLPLYSWYDGLRSGYARSLEQVPPALLRRVEEQGWMRASTAPLRPLADLEVRFLVRKPTRQDRVEKLPAAPPPGCEHPAILIPSTEPVALVDAEGRPLDVPLITEPAEALAVLGRAYNGRIYVPHAHCLDPAEVPCGGSRSEWLVGVLPRCLAA